MRRLPSGLSVLLMVLFTAGCARQAPPPTAPEAQLLEQLTRDPFVVIDYQHREEDGYLTVRTRQGKVTRMYRLMPANDGGGPLVIRWLDESQVLPVAWSEDRLGTGPQWRGHRE